jgi:hypothetical protein
LTGQAFSSSRRDPIRAMMPGERLKPIYSSRGNDPAVSDLVDRFVIGLGERIDELQDLEVEGGFDRIAPLARSLAADALRAGFDELAAVTGALEAASAEQNPEETRKHLVELTGLVHRVRLGHTGAA